MHTAPTLLLLSLLPALALAQQPPPDPAPEPSPPRLVTEQTRADPAESARLTRPGQRVFEDTFDTEASFRSWFEVRGRDEGHAAIDTAAGHVHGGKGSLRLTSIARDGKSSGAGAERWLGDEGYDCVHLRYWIRYADDYDQGNLHHTGGSISGVAGTGKWDGMGGAGLRPAGDDNFSTRVEGWRDWRRLPAPGYLHCYTYWMEMQQNPDGHYWGNMLEPAAAERFVPPLGKWLCVEQRVAVNTPGAADGELAVWLDGRLYLHYRGLRWRSTGSVRIKRIGLLAYVHEARRDNTVWFDDVVVATGYIGTGEPPADPAAK